MKLLALLPLFLLPILSLSAQTDAGQTIAGIKTESDPITVANGLEEHVTIRAGDTTVSLPAAEALKIADWLKREQTDNYGAAKVLKISRVGGTVVVLLTPPDGPTKELRLGQESASQFATALASASQNVSPQTKS